MAKTISDMAAAVKGKIGARVTGKIGQRAVDDVVVEKIYEAMLEIAKSPECKFLQTFAETSFDENNFVYDLPTENLDGDTIRIKNISDLHIKIEGDSNSFPLDRITPKHMSDMVGIRDTSRTRRPAFYCFYNNQIELDCYPDTTYVVQMRVNLWPSTININSTCPFDDEWNNVIEIGAAALCFRELQQTEDAESQLAEFRRLMITTFAAHNQDPDWRPSALPPSMRRNRVPAASIIDAYVR